MAAAGPPQVEQILALLEQAPPFDALTAEARAALAAASQVVDYAAEVAVLVEDGPPADGMWLLLEGSVELLHDGQQVLELGSGECFGHPSLLTGMAPAYTVRTRAPVRCVWLPPALAREAFATAAGATYLASSLRSRLVRQGYAVRSLMDVATAPASAIMRPPRFLDADARVRDALLALDEEGVSAVLLPVGDTTGIVTDAEIRVAVGAAAVGGSAGAAASGLELDAPAATLARVPVATVPVGQLAVEAAVDMLAAGSGSGCVAVVDGARIVGTLAAEDLVGLDARSPIALRYTILGAADLDGLIRSVAHLPQLFLLLQRAGVPPRDLGRVLSLQHDAIVSRLLDFAIARHGTPPVAWAWLDLGSAARREFTLASDQDNAFAYGEPPPGSSSHELDEYFARVTDEVCTGLARCGIGEDNNGVLASDRRWRMSKAAWIATFDECFRVPDESHLIRATVAFDFRAAAGGLPLAAELSGRIRVARGYPDFMRLMALTACGYPVALGRRGHLATGRLDEPAGLLDIKRGVIIPLVNLVRYHALAAGVTISPTLDRIEAAASLGQLERATADALHEAYDVIAGVRFAHHAQQIDDGVPLDNLIDPQALAPIVRGDLEAALQEVRRAQRRVETLAGR
jgi:CBS domain-containing protein